MQKAEDWPTEKLPGNHFYRAFSLVGACAGASFIGTTLLQHAGAFLRSENGLIGLGVVGLALAGLVYWGFPSSVTAASSRKGRVSHPTWSHQSLADDGAGCGEEVRLTLHLISLDCPSCGSALHGEGMDTIFFCDHCGDAATLSEEGLEMVESSALLPGSRPLRRSVASGLAGGG